MKYSKKIGDKGEVVASEYLIRNRYSIVCRNFRRKHCEIDIVAQKGNLISFVEVKTSIRKNSFPIGDRITKHKLKKIMSCANYWISSDTKASIHTYEILVIEVCKDKNRFLVVNTTVIGV